VRKNKNGEDPHAGKNVGKRVSDGVWEKGIKKWCPQHKKKKGEEGEDLSDFKKKRTSH